MIRYIFIIFFISPLLSQEFFLHKFNSNDSLLTLNFYRHLGKEITEDIIQAEIDKRLDIANEMGFWFFSSHITEFSEFKRNDSLFADISVIVDHKNSSILDTILFLNVKSTPYSTLLRESRLRTKEVISYKSLKRASQYLNHSNYIDEVKRYQSFRIDSNHFALAFDLIELNTSFLNGIIGFSPAQKNKAAEITTDIEIEFSNIAGSGRYIHFNWEKKSARTQLIKLEYREPWIFGFPLHQNFLIKQILQDSIYSKWLFSTSSEFPLNEFFSVQANISFSTITPTNLIQANAYKLPVTRFNDNGFKVNYINLNRRFNPQYGLKASLEFSHRSQELIRPQSIIDRYKLKKQSSKNLIKFDLSWYYPLFKQHVFLLKTNHLYKNLDILYETDFVYFGGAKSLRGFRENQFKTIQLHQFAFEYRILLGEKSRLSFFLDHAKYKSRFDNNIHSLSALGVGIRFETKVGILGVDYAFESDQPFKNALIHVGLYGTID